MSTEPRAAHEQAAELIPFLVNGTLAGAEAAAVRAHVDACAHCRDEYRAQLQVHAAMHGDASLVFASEASFNKLMARVDAAEREDVFALRSALDGAAPPRGRPLPSRSAPRRGRALQWLAAAVIVQALGLSYGAWLWHAQSSTPDAPYRTLTSAAPVVASGARVRVVFAPGMTLERLQPLLHSIGARIVDGPTPANVYTLGFIERVPSTADLDHRVDTLRASGDVRFAEGITAGTP
jgi:hypothetical protein